MKNPAALAVTFPISGCGWRVAVMDWYWLHWAIEMLIINQHVLSELFFVLFLYYILQIR